MNKEIFRCLLASFLILAIISTTFIVSDNVFAKDNAPKGFETYYMGGYGFNIPKSFKLSSDGFDDVNNVNYMNYKKGKKFINISLERHSKFNKNLMDSYSVFNWNGLNHYKTDIAGITGFYTKSHGVKSFVFSSEDDIVYIKAKGVKLSNILSSIKQREYKPYYNSEYDFDDAYYESDVYDDSFDDSFDDASYYTYNW